MKIALIVAAHADDETLGCGGTIQLLINQGWSVHVVILSDGLRYQGNGNNNIQGAREACKVLGVENLNILNFPDQKFDTIAIAEISKKVSDLNINPDLIFCNDYLDLNYDHRITCEVAKIIGRPLKKPVSILSMEIPNTAFWNGRDFEGNFYVDISDYIYKKIEAFKCYKNEIKDYPHPWSEKGLFQLAQFRGMQCGLDFAESFKIIRAYPNCLPGTYLDK